LGLVVPQVETVVLLTQHPHLVATKEKVASTSPAVAQVVHRPTLVAQQHQAMKAVAVAVAQGRSALRPQT
jgi:hypothetical protein